MNIDRRKQIILGKNICETCREVKELKYFYKNNNKCKECSQAEYKCAYEPGFTPRKEPKSVKSPSVYALPSNSGDVHVYNKSYIVKQEDPNS